MNVDNRGPLPLSAAQRAVWLDLQLHPGDVRYNICSYIEMHGALDVERLIAAIKYFIASSATFGIQFVGKKLNPEQCFRASIQVDVTVIDLSSAADPEAAALKYIEQDQACAFDLYAAPLFRNVVLKLSPVRHFWHSNYHHLICDGFTYHLAGIHVSQAYATLARGPLAERTGDDYSYYLRAEAEYRSSAQFAIDRDYWVNVYAELPVPASLSVRPVRGDARRIANLHDAWLPADLLDKFYAYSAARNIGVGQLFVAAIGLYLQRMTGARDIPLCMPTHGRERGPTMAISGMCVNTLPLRLTVDPLATVEQNIKQIDLAILAAVKHRRYRYEDLRADLGLVGGEVPFRHFANILRTADAWVFTDQPVKVVTTSVGPVEDLNFMVFENSTDRAHFHTALIWNPALYEAWEIECHHRYFHRFLGELIEDPNRPLKEIAVLTDVEQKELLSGTNNTARSWSGAHCFHQLFAERAARSPDAIAVVLNDDALTYAELDARANQLANYLLERGVEHEQVIGVCLDRSIEAIVAFLAILKAGAAYLPLEPDLPAARLTFMVKDASVKIIVSHSAYELLLPDHLATPLFLDEVAADLELCSKATAGKDVASDNLAYVIYTSGSTGQPKGVLLQHDGLCNLAHAQAEQFGVLAGVRVLQFAKLSFDASVSEIAMTLVSGGTLVLAARYDLLPGNLGTTLAVQKIAVVTLPPSILPSLSEDVLSDLKTLIVAGESCPVELAREWIKRCRVINAYGPTETTVCATAGEYRGQSVVSIGYPIANTCLYILDEFLKPSPVGIVGEIFVGGVGVARGYLNRESLTAERFIRNPFVEAASRLYRTGDLARLLPDGMIEFLGRKDQQIKLRGFRVELGEIEAVIASHKSVVESAVILCSFGGRKRLVAYAVKLAGGDDVDSAALRTYLRGKLPEYMIPATTIFLSALPRTPSGKLDRKTLPIPDASVVDRVIAPPTTETENKLVKIWSEALSGEAVGITDNFLDLGGDSLGALNVVALVWDVFAIELPPQSVYETASLAELAQRIDQLTADFAQLEAIT